jgi:hypothetical protein
MFSEIIGGVEMNNNGGLIVIITALEIIAFILMFIGVSIGFGGLI